MLRQSKLSDSLERDKDNSRSNKTFGAKYDSNMHHCDGRLCEICGRAIVSPKNNFELKSDRAGSSIYVKNDSHGEQFKQKVLEKVQKKNNEYLQNVTTAWKDSYARPKLSNRDYK